ncbi:hypothetical protein [Dysgonomonas sp. ZJ709]|uniref:hypothetical protein n=1 Tax=Dysgonomonas sp. ZJ709 TaxID=2709797 RepID=UPI0013EBCAB8|nr:hypothetical protein [Dysgonomonas sp. ZJ709]
MKRYYSHFTFIYPDIYLKNHVVELDSENRIVKCFPFEKEIEKTEFYSGWLMFVPTELKSFDIRLLNREGGKIGEFDLQNINQVVKNIGYNIYYENHQIL